MPKVWRFIISSYLLVALVYTAYSYVLVPALGLGGDAGEVFEQRAVVVDAPAPLTSEIPSAAKKHPALETAGVRAGDIRAEDSIDPVWAAAEGPRGADSTLLDTTSSRLFNTIREHGLAGVDWDRDAMAWSSDGPTVGISEDRFLSLSFSSSLQPSKVIPYYYRARAPDAPDFNTEDITITTLVTSNRFTIFRRLVERYQGPISATVHVAQDVDLAILRELDDLYHSTPLMAQFVDIHLVVDPFDRQFNMWRNVAKYFARTAYVMMLDVDFWLCTDFRSRMLASPEIMERLRGGLSAFVVPAFEFAKQSDGVDPATFPSKKSELLKLVHDHKIDMFHKSWAPGHGSTNYTRYYEANVGEVYRVVDYTHSYEPYVIFKKEGSPWCDERFVGYGGNKAACLYEIYLSGISFYVLPDDFLIHQSHAYAENSRKHERKYNRKLYTDFREELCFRYLNMFLDHIESPRAKNLANECKKMKGFSTTAARFISSQQRSS